MFDGNCSWEWGGVSFVNCMDAFHPSSLFHHCCFLNLVGRVVLIFRCFSQSVPSWRIQTRMIHWCQKLLTCTRQTGPSTRQLLGAGLRSMPWARPSVLCGLLGASLFLPCHVKMKCQRTKICTLHMIWKRASVLYCFAVSRSFASLTVTSFLCFLQVYLVLLLTHGWSKFGFSFYLYS